MRRVGFDSDYIALALLLAKLRPNRRIRDIADDVIAMRKAAKRHRAAWRKYTNDDLASWLTPKRVIRIARAMQTINDVAKLYGAKVTYAKDPMAYTVYLHLPNIDGAFTQNTSLADAWGV